MQYKPAKGFDGMILWGGGLGGPRAIPGKYSVEFNYNHMLTRKSFSILPDPRLPTTANDFNLYEQFATQVRDKLTEANKAIISIRDIRQQLNNYKERIPKQDSLKKEITKIDSVMTKIEEALYQTKNKSGQDPLNFPIRLTDKLAYLNSILGNGEYPPTEQAYAVRKELEEDIDMQLAKFLKVKTEMLPAFNRLVREKGIDAIIVKE